MNDFLDHREHTRSETARAFAAAQASLPTASVHDPAPPRTTRAQPTRRVVTIAERHATTVAAIATRVAQRMPKVEAVAAALAIPTMRAASSRDGGRGSDHPDPAAGIALGHQDYDDLRDAVSAWLEQGKWIEARQIAYLREHPDTAAAKSDDLKSLCTEPGCDFRAVRRGICWHHYELELEAERVADQHHHTPTTPVIASGASWSPVPPTSGPTLTVATCGRCGWLGKAHDAQHAAILLAAHHAGDCPAIEQTTTA